MRIRCVVARASKMRHKAAVLFLAFGGLVALIAWGFHRNSVIAARFRAVHAGVSETEVVRLLGKPSWVEPCGKSFGTPRPNCTEYIYRDSFAPLIPEYHSVALDNSGRVLDDYVYSSP
jgi:hypothetical protein